MTDVADGNDDRSARLESLLSVELDASSATTTRPRRRRARDVDAAPQVVDRRDERSDDEDPSSRAEPTVTPGSPQRSGLRRAISVLSLLALFASGIGLTYAGTRILRSSTQGEVVEPVDDPTAPGFEAIVDPTPTLALHHDLDGSVDAITVLTLPDPDGVGGGVLLVPTRIMQDLPLFGQAPLESGYDLGTPELQTEFVGDLLGAGIAETAVVDAGRWADLVAPVAPLVIDNPDELVVDGEVRFTTGELALAPTDVGPYLEARVPGESELARLFRHELFWRAWLDAVAGSDRPDAVPGEVESGIGRFVRTIAAGPAIVETVPAEPSVSEDFVDEPVFVVDEAGLDALVERLVPFPRSPRPGERPRLRLLNGTPDLDAAEEIAAQLPPAGVEVVLVGNATSLDESTTSITYALPEHRAVAERVRSIVGVGEVTEDVTQSDTADITVTLGADHG